MSTYLTTAIPLVLRSFRQDEVLAELLTSDHGKVTVRLRGGKKIQSKLRGRLEHRGIVTVMIAPGKQLDILAGISTHTYFSDCINNPQKRITVIAFEETIARLLHELQADQLLYTTLVQWLQMVERLPKYANWPVVFAAGVFRVLCILGLSPELDRCSIHQTTLETAQIWYAPTLGGWIGPQAAKTIPSTRVDPLIIEILRFLKQSHTSREISDYIANISQSPVVYTGFYEMVVAYAQHVVEFEIPSLTVYTEIVNNL